MGSFFPALQTQLPAQALGQSVGAVTAYEQLSDIRNRRQAAAEQAKKQALIQQLHGRAALGDRQALQGLLMASPETGLGLIKQHQEFQQSKQGLEKGSLDIQTSQAQLGREQLQTQGAERAEALRKANAARRAIGIVRQNPDNPDIYRRAVFAMEKQGVIPEGALDPNTPPNPEDLADFERQIDMSEALLRNPEEADKLTGELRELEAATGGRDTPEFQHGAQRLIESRIGLREAQAAKARRPSAPLIQFGPTTGTRAKFEQENTRDRILLGNLNALKNMLPQIRDLNTYQGRLRTLGAKYADRLGLLDPEGGEAARLKATQAYKTRIGFTFNPIKLFFTGAAAPLREMEQIEDQIISGDMGPVQLEGAVNELINVTDDAIAARQAVLRQGINPTDSAFNDLVSSEYLNRRYSSAQSGAGRQTEPQITTRAPPVPGQPVTQALPGQAPPAAAQAQQPAQRRDGQPRLAGEAKKARLGIANFKKRLRERQRNADPFAGQRKAPTPEPAVRRGARTGQAVAPNQLTQEQATQLEQVFEQMGGNADALRMMFEQGIIDEDLMQSTMQQLEANR